MKSEYNKNLHCTISKNINDYMSKFNISLKTLATKSDVPYETIKKIVNGETYNPSLLNCIKISNALQIPISELIDTKSCKNEKFDNLSKNAKELVKKMSEFESSIYEENDKNQKSLNSVDLPLFESYIDENDNLKFTSKNPYETIKLYVERFYKNHIFGLHLSDDRFFPVYFKNDIIVISNDRFPKTGDAIIFTYNNEIYIENYYPNQNDIFSPLNKFIHHFNGNINEIDIKGYVLTVLRTGNNKF